jgi:hypothetical protein
MAKAVSDVRTLSGRRSPARESVAQDIVKSARTRRAPPSRRRSASRCTRLEVGAPTDVTLIDLGNEPGTLVNGARVKEQAPRRRSDPGSAEPSSCSGGGRARRETAAPYVEAPGPFRGAAAPAPVPLRLPPRTRSRCGGAVCAAAVATRSAVAGRVRSGLSRSLEPFGGLSALNPFAAGAAVDRGRGRARERSR